MVSQLKFFYKSTAKQFNGLTDPEIVYLGMVPAGIRTDVCPVVVEREGGTPSYINIGVQIPVSGKNLSLEGQ